MGTIARMQAAVSALPDGPVKRDLQRAVAEVIELREAAGDALKELRGLEEFLDGEGYCAISSAAKAKNRANSALEAMKS
jgi:hypothetical protein